MFKADKMSSEHPRDIAIERGWGLIKDSDDLKELAKSVVLDPRNGQQLKQYKQGGKKMVKMEKFFFGQAMRLSNGNARPELLLEALQQSLAKEVP
jgi:Asp-tRNA(Asn)/Glu-tRNA(Gln) amidotransferase B subunit